MDSASDDLKYAQFQEKQLKIWEECCTHCGACCGSVEGDPCEHLQRSDNGRYVCGIYENRFGIYKTRSGRDVRCVPIREILHKSWPGDQCCGYKK